MLLRRFTDLVLRSRFHAMGIAFLLSLIPLFGASLGILVAALVTLRKGAFEGTLVLGATLLPYFMGYVLSPAETESHMMVVATVTLVAIHVLTWFLALVLRRHASWNQVIEVSILAGILLVGAVHLVFPDIQGWWDAQLTAWLGKTTDFLKQVTPPGATTDADMQASVVASIRQYMTGLMVASVIFNALLQLVIARGWQAMIFNPGGLRQELYQIRLGYVSAAVFIVVLALGYARNTFGLDMMPVMVVAFGAAGLSLAHRMLSANRAGWFWLLWVYLGVLFVFPVGIVLVAMAGLLDSLFNIRARTGR